MFILLNYFFLLKFPNANALSFLASDLETFTSFLAGALANIGISVAVSEINDTQNQVQVAEQQATI